MNINKEIKKLLIDADITLTELARIISVTKDKHYSVQNLSQKLKSNTINAKEIEIILDTLGYRICFLPKEK
ncbi:hypothetical protein IJZ97_02020 [bacterium]|nr:hypothetical protein [bacterium]